MNNKIKIDSIFHPVAINKGLGSLHVENDYVSHVEQMMKQVLFTSPGERINRVDFGCGVRRFIFAPNNTASANLIQITIFQALDKWLGDLIKVDTLDVNADNEKLTITINYILKARQEKRSLNVEVI